MSYRKQRLIEFVQEGLEEDDRVNVFGYYAYRYNLSDGFLSMFHIKKDNSIVRFDLPDYEVVFKEYSIETKERKVRKIMKEVVSNA